jgi:hypothetical protein
MDVADIKPWDKDRILVEIGPIVALLTSALEYATAEATSFFAGLTLREAESRDPYLFAHLVRFHAGEFLIARGHDSPIDKHWLANSGVAFQVSWVDVRVLKSSFRGLPAPGPSMTKRRFYRQWVAPSLWDVDDENKRTPTLVNIVVTWDVDSRGHLSQLVAYCPSDGLNSPDSVHWYWSEPLIHPAESYEPPPVPPTEPGEDIDITEEPGEVAADADDAEVQ